MFLEHLSTRHPDSVEILKPGSDAEQVSEKKVAFSLNQRNVVPVKQGLGGGVGPAPGAGEMGQSFADAAGGGAGPIQVPGLGL